MHRSYLGSLWHFHKPTHLNNHTQSKRTEYNQEPGTPSDEHTGKNDSTFLKWQKLEKKQGKWPPRGKSFNKCNVNFSGIPAVMTITKDPLEKVENGERLQDNLALSLWKHKQYINTRTALYVPTYNCFPCVPDKFQEMVLGDLSKMVKH